MKPADRSTAKREDSDDEMLDEYSDYLDAGVQAKYFGQALKAGGLVKLDPDVPDMFPDSKDVNEALRAFMREAQKQLGEKLTAKEILATLQND
jgi:hypothetical protein